MLTHSEQRDQIMYYLHVALVWIFLGFPIPNKDPYLSTLLVCIFIISFWADRYWYEFFPVE